MNLTLPRWRGQGEDFLDHPTPYFNWSVTDGLIEKNNIKPQINDVLLNSIPSIF